MSGATGHLTARPISTTVMFTLESSSDNNETNNLKADKALNFLEFCLFTIVSCCPDLDTCQLPPTSTIFMENSDKMHLYSEKNTAGGNFCSQVAHGKCSYEEC